MVGDIDDNDENTGADEDGKSTKKNQKDTNTEPKLTPEEKAAAEAKAAAERAERTEQERGVLAGQEYVRRKAEEVIHENPDEHETPKAGDVLARANAVKQELESYADEMQDVLEKARQSKKGKSVVRSLAEQRIVGDMTAFIDKRLAIIEPLGLVKWEQGNVTPGAFLARYAEYIKKQDDDDAKDKHWTADEKIARKASRAKLLEDAKKAVEDARKTMPQDMALADVRRVQAGVTEEELWKLYSVQEREQIVNKISEAAGLNVVKLAINEEIEDIQDVIREKNIKEKIRMQMREIIEAEQGPKSSHAKQREAEMSEISDPITAMSRMATNVNNTLGIEWLTFNEWKAAFGEVIESIKEVRKRKSIGRITRAALGIGRVAALLPGTGGSDLVNVLEEQQQKKNDEIKDDLKKELGDNRKDYGFMDLFIKGADGGPSELKKYIAIHDTNRTRAVVEFAAGKGLLYDIDESNWKEYVLPGGVAFRDAMPAEWTDAQVDNYFGNLQFANRQGQDAQTKAGETLASGRSSLMGYLDPLKGAVNGMSLWLAKGIANKALSKVKNGEMSALITLTVLDAWENNEVFRQYVPYEWLDRFSGDSKQLMVGMIKYDQRHLVAGARIPGLITHNVEEADAMANDPDPKKRGKQRLGPLVATIRRYIINKNPALKNDPEKLRLFTARVMASQTVDLGNGEVASLYVPEIAKKHIQYGPNEMRGANVKELGDDFFIERSEIIHGTVEVMKSIGAVNQDGFAFGEKPRYYFSHIIDNYNELVDQAKKFDAQGRAADAQEMRDAAEKFKADLSPQLNEWVKEALQGNGGMKITNVQHAKQDGRYLLVTLTQKGLISESVLEQMQRDNNKPARKILSMLKNLRGGEGNVRNRWNDQPGAPGVHQPIGGVL